MTHLHLHKNEQGKWKAVDSDSVAIAPVWGMEASVSRAAIFFHPSEASARAAATAQTDARPKSKPTGPAPSNLREQLRAGALSRSGVFNSRASRAEFDAAFDALWTALETEAAKLRGAMDSQDNREREAGEKCGVSYLENGCDWPDAVAEKVLALRCENERLRTIIAQAREQFTDSERPFYAGMKILNETQQP